MEAEGGQVAHLNIGIGLNVNNHPEEQEPMAVSLRGLLGRSVPRREILVDFLERFQQRLTDFDSTELLAQWKANNSTIGKQVSIRTVKEQLEGRAVDIDEHGGLVLEAIDGSLTTAVHGDCFYN